MSRIAAIARIVCLEMLRQKALYVLLILVGAVLFAVASVDVFGMAGIVRHVQDIGLLAVWALAWGTGALVSVRQLPRLEKTGGIYSLLARPLSRGELLMGKWLGAWCLTVTVMLACMATVMAVVALHGGGFHSATVFQALTLHMAALAMICAAGIAFSTSMGEDAALAVTLLLTAGSYFIMPRLPYLLAAMSAPQAAPLYLFHYLAPHLEWFDLRRRWVHAWGPAPWKVYATVMSYGVCWTAAVLYCGRFAYMRKRFEGAS